MNDQTFDNTPAPAPAHEPVPAAPVNIPPRVRSEIAKRAQARILAERKPGQPYPSLRKLGAYGPQPEPRLAYLSKGHTITASGRVVTNPGFPFVNLRPGVDWTAGGLPLGFDRETALAYMREQAERAAETPAEETPK